MYAFTINNYLCIYHQLLGNLSEDIYSFTLGMFTKFCIITPNLPATSLNASGNDF